MAKEMIFKMRIDDADKRRIDKLAAHYSAPASTVLRILVRDRYEDLRCAGRISAKTTKSHKQGEKENGKS